MGGQKGQSQDARLADGYNRGYAAYQPNVDPKSQPGVNDSNLSQAYIKGWQSKADEIAKQDEWNGMFSSFMESLNAPDNSMDLYNQQIAGQQEEYDRRLKESQLAQGRQKTSDKYADYLNSANQATDYINSEISKEQSNAALMGVDYKMDDDTKKSRIENYFASTWGEGDQAELEGLVGQYGAPQGFKGFTVKRGDASAYQQKGGEEKVVGASKGLNPAAILSDDEEEGKKGNLLGV